MDLPQGFSIPAGPGLPFDLDIAVSGQFPGHARGRVTYELKYIGVYVSEHRHMHECMHMCVWSSHKSPLKIF